VSHQEALEFIGEARAGISWERFCIHGVRHSDAFIDILNDTEGARKFLSSMGISREYISGQITKILYRLHFNRENDHYLTLALPHNASESQIHKRWKELMLLYHPDRNRDEEAASCAARINEAYSVLKNPEKRREYHRRRAEGHHLRPEIRKFRTPPPEEHVLGSPKMRSILSKLIIPSCVAIAGVILLVMFLENRQQRRVYQAGVTDKADGRQQASVKEKAPVEVKEKAQEKGEVKEKAQAQVKAQKQAKIEIQINTREKAKGEVKAEEEKQIQEKKQAEEENQVKAKVKGEEQKQEKPRDTAGEGGLRPSPVPQQQSVAKAEPENIERWVNLFISRYTRAYEEGDIEKFMSLYVRSAVENGRMNYDEIKRAYKHNFEKSRYRYSLRNVQFRKNGDDVIVVASYIINKSVDAGGEALVQGDIRWILAREGGALKVLKVDYERR